MAKQLMTVMKIQQALLRGVAARSSVSSSTLVQVGLPIDAKLSAFILSLASGLHLDSN